MGSTISFGADAPAALHLLVGARVTVNFLVMSSSQRILASGCIRGTLQYYAKESGDEYFYTIVCSSEYPFAFAADYVTLVTSSADETLIFLEYTIGKKNT